MSGFHRAKNVFFVFLLLVLWAPVFQHATGLVKERGLQGASYRIAPRPLKGKTWFKGKFQKRLDRYSKYNFGFRATMVRIKNEIDWSCFGLLNNANVFRGSDNYLFGHSYLESYLGDDLIGNDSIQQQLEMLQTVRDSLAKRNISVLVLIAPNKVRFLQQYIPEELMQREAQPTNYAFFTQGLRERGIPTIDYNLAYASWQHEHDTLLYTRYGTHWSMYGSVLAADTLLHTLDALRNETFRKFRVTGLTHPTKPKFTDADLLQILNTWYPIGTEKTTLPVLEFDSTGPRPRVLAISDSFYWSFYSMQVVEKCFDPTSELWFYHQTAYGHDGEIVGHAFDADLDSRLQQTDVVLLMATSANLDDLGAGFIERAYAYFVGNKWKPREKHKI